MSTIRSAVALTGCLTVLCSLSAFAQQPAAPAVDVPPMTCVSPGSAPIDRASPSMTRFSKRVEEYKVCVNQYTAMVGAKANDLAAQSRAYSDAANKAIDDYNAYIIALNESTKSTKSGAEKN